MRHPFVLLGLSLALAAPAAPAAAAPPAPPAHVAAAASPLPWIADDWPRAVSLAKARKVPIFVENWAPW
jgi:hypothetical protein